MPDTTAIPVPSNWPGTPEQWASQPDAFKANWLAGSARTDEQKNADAGGRNFMPRIPTVGSASASFQPGFQPGGQPTMYGSQSMPTRGGPSGGSGVGGWLKDNWMGVAGVGLGLWGAYNDHQRDKRADAMDDRAIDFKERQYEEMTPLRVGAMSGLANTRRADLTGFTADPGNPYTRSAPDVGHDEVTRPIGTMPVVPMVGSASPRRPVGRRGL